MRSAAKVERHVEEVLGEHCGFDVPAVIFTPAELREVHDDAQGLAPPFPPGDGQRRYVTFFKAGHVPDREVAARIAAWDEPGESAVVIGRAVHVWLNRAVDGREVLPGVQEGARPRHRRATSRWSARSARSGLAQLGRGSAPTSLSERLRGRVAHGPRGQRDQRDQRRRPRR